MKFEDFFKKNGEIILSKYKKLLIGKKVVKLEDIVLDSDFNIIKGIVTLNDGQKHDVYWREATNEDKRLGREYDPEYFPMKDYFDKYIKGRIIQQLSLDAHIYNNPFILCNQIDKLSLILCHFNDSSFGELQLMIGINSKVVDIETEKQTMDRLNKLISNFYSSQKLSKILLDKYFLKV